VSEEPAANAKGELLSFGELLVERGLVAEERLQFALQLQRDQAGAGIFLRLGELLVAQGDLQEDTVSSVLGLQGLTIRWCARCTAQFNVRGEDTNACPRCQQPLTEPPSFGGVSVEDTVGADPEESLTEGRTFGNYVILGRISRGGMGIVYKAKQISLDRIVAMKVLAEREEATPADFIREAQAVAQLRHPYVVAIHEVGRHEGVDYFTMDYVEGLPLNQVAASEGLSEREVASILLKVCEAVHYAHTQGLLHRDLKPANILVDRKRSPVLIDFGIAKGKDDEEDEGSIVGSPAYLPPEYLTGAGRYGIAGEVYALGATLYSALAGQTPHTGVDTVQVLKRAQVETPTHIRRVRRSVSRDLGEIVMTALQRDPDYRYSTVQDLANDLRRWLEGEEIAGRSSWLQRRWARVRGKVAAAFGILLALVLLVVTVSFTLKEAQSRSTRSEGEAQWRRERTALESELVEAELSQARLLLELLRPAEAEVLLTRTLDRQEAPGRRVDLLSLRAEAREALGDTASAADDRRAAAALAHSEK